MQASKKYESKKVIEYIDELSLGNSRYEQKMNALEGCFDAYVGNDTYSGSAAEASKKFIDISERRLLKETYELNNELLDLYEHSQESFSRNVDSDIDAKIDTDTIDLIQRDFQRYYEPLNEHGRNIERKASELSMKYGKYGNITCPSYDGARKSFTKFCGGNELGTGYLFDSAMKFVKYDDEECDYIHDSGIFEKIEDSKQRIQVSTSLLNAAKVIAYELSKQEISLISTSVGTAKNWNEKDGFSQGTAGKLNAVLDIVTLLGGGIGPLLLLWDFRAGTDGNLHVDTHDVRAGGNCWQQLMGYMELYDKAFDFGTEMQTDKMSFIHDDEEYTLWYWKGDYLNLGAGGECGVYRGDGYLKECATDMTIHMTIEVDYADGSSSEVWTDDTWWITDFNPTQLFYDEEKVKDLQITYTVDMSFLSDDEWYCFIENNKAAHDLIIDGRTIKFTL